MTNHQKQYIDLLLLIASTWLDMSQNGDMPRHLPTAQVNFELCKGSWYPNTHYETMILLLFRKMRCYNIYLLFWYGTFLLWYISIHLMYHRGCITTYLVAWYYLIITENIFKFYHPTYAIWNKFIYHNTLKCVYIYF